MRIAFYAPRASCLKPGDFGHRGFVLALLAVLRERGHEVEIVSRVNVRDFPRGRLPARSLIAEARSIRRAMKRFAPEVWLVYGTSVKNPDVFGWWQHPKRYLLINQEGRGGRELPQGWRWLFGSAHRRSLARADQDSGVSVKEPLILEIEQAVQQTRLRLARPDRECDSLASDQALYLDLLKKCLTRYIFPETYRPNHPSRRRFKRFFYVGLQKLLAFDNLTLVRHESFDPDARAKGRDFPLEGETMIGLEGLSNLQYCITDVLKRGVAGDLIETGIWRGGATVFMRAVLKAFGDTQRVVWAADSFQGVPEGRYSLRASKRLQQQVSL